MDYFNAYSFFVLIFVHQIVGATKKDKENYLWMFYVNNDTNATESCTQRPRYTKPINVNLSVSYLPITKSVQKDLETFCETLTKVKMVALLYPPNFENNIELTLAGHHLAVPKFNARQTSEDTQEHFQVSLYPRLPDSFPKIMEILKTRIPAAVICNTDMYEEIKDFNMYPYHRDDIQFYPLSSGVSSSKRTRMIAEVLANIRKLKINILVVYVDQDNLSEVLTLGEMMQMTGAEYKWILPWESVPSYISHPSNFFILQPKNSTTFLENVLLDAVELIKQGFRSYTNKFTKYSVPFVSCFDTISSSFGEELYRNLIQQSFVGKTGYIAFDKRGNRINAEYQIVNSNNDIVTITPPSYHQKNKPRKLRAVTAPSVPFVYINQIVNNQHNCGKGWICHVYSTDSNHAEQYCCEGYVIDMLHLLQTDLAVDIELHIAKDGKYGSVDENTNQWDGMIGELIQNEVDIAIADLTITESRSRVVDFTHPFMESGVGVMVRTDRQGITQGIWAFLQPVAAELWIATFLAISFMGILFWTMERIAFCVFHKFAKHKNEEKHEIRRKTLAQFSFAASLQYSWSTVVRTRDKVTRPSNTSAKIGAISLALCFLVFITTYTAQLAAFLVAELHVTPIAGGIEDSKLQNPSNNLRIATIKGSSIETFFRTSPDPKFVNIWRRMMGNNVPSTDIGVKRLKKNELDVLFGDYNTVVFMAAQDPDCSLRVLGEPFFKSGYGIALPRNSTWTPILSKKLLQYEKFDTFIELAHRWMKTSCDGNQETVNSLNFNTFHRMSAYDLSGMFVVLATGVLLSWILLAVEFYYKSHHQDKRTT